jgi:hypothetical protein
MVDEPKPKPPTRHFFRKAIAPPPRVPAPQHKGKTVMVQLGSGQTRIMASGELALQRGRSKGGLTSAARGVAHRWTSEEAKKAHKKSLGKLCTRIGVRVGRRAKRRPAVKRAPLRERHCFPNVVEGITFDPVSRKWIVHQAPDSLTVPMWREIGERAALQRLGYLPTKRKGFVPTSTTRIKPLNSFKKR